ncbi:hypothetical protein RhiJN_17199 [Ceratobasidium sp. AG-Ba]|nr:hypothetical protein RhiJN_17199 [Ceratobasidium sp. AG-Ba]
MPIQPQGDQYITYITALAFSLRLNDRLPENSTRAMSIDHVGLGGMKDLDAAQAFYEKALAPLGFRVRMTIPGEAIGFGTAPCQPNFWIASSPVGRGNAPPSEAAAHVAFKGTQDQVRAFDEAALGAGGKCNGPPGFRTNYHPFYYASFIIDPYGNNIELGGEPRFIMAMVLVYRRD